jgi:hypothetical protein
MVEVVKEVYMVKEGVYGFRVYVNGELRVIQEFKPSVEGFQPMSEEEANAEAEKILLPFYRADALLRISEYALELFTESLIANVMDKIKVKFKEEIEKYGIRDEEIVSAIRESIRRL